jgi:hypothetical protein
MHRKGERQARPTGPSCVYECETCGVQEEIPGAVLDYFDEMDPGEPGAPPTFQCQKCPGIMYPVSWLRAKRAAP